MLTLGRKTSQAPIPTAGPRKKVNAGVGRLDLYARHGVMLAEVVAGAGEDAGRQADGDAGMATRSGV
ncbi:MAG: hypothetical protein WB795_25125 [Candidatus Acidiferrales bacterium]